ncbi:ATP-binding cassette domain-containing protein [Bartonella sp. DGB1]|uniref:ATP-binding cassette domain-containing protein n=1 Tax=Bartonella sp. DGB1 TaxID=3239807 RepID=UPI003524C960
MIDFVIKVIKKNFWMFLGVLLVVTLSKAILVLPPIILGKIINAMTDGLIFDIGYIWQWLLLFLGAIITQAVITPIQSIGLTTFIQRAVKENSLIWTKQILNKEFCFFDNLRIGQILKTYERGIHAHESLLHFIVNNIFPLLVQSIVFAILLYTAGDIIILSWTILGCAIYLIITHYIIKWRRQHIDKLNESEDNLIGETATLFNSAKAIKLEQSVKTALNPLVKAYSSYVDSAIKVSYSASFLSINKILSINFAIFILLIWTILDQSSETPYINAGKLVVLFAAVNSFFNSVAEIGENYRFLNQFSADRKSLHELLEQKSFEREAKTNLKLDNKKIDLILEKITINNSDTASLILDHPITIKYGEKVALIGESGGGKTTLLESLVGLNIEARKKLFIKISKQNIVNINDLSSKQHLDLIHYVPQQPQFLEGDIKQAVFFGKNNIEPIKGIEELGVQHFFNNDARKINEGAKNISGGEAKRLSLLRMINNISPINLLDEPTSAIDPQLAKNVWEAIFSAVGDNSLIAVTHDIENLYRFTRVIIVDKSKIIVDDTPERIINNPEFQHIKEKINV